MTFQRRSLPGIEIAYLVCTGNTFAKHAHDEFVISANLVGREYIWLDGHTYEAERAQATIYNPGQVQSSGAGDAPWSFISFYLEPTPVMHLVGLTPDVVFDQPILWDEALAELVRTRGARCLNTAVDEGEVLETVVDLLGKLLDAAGSRRPVRTFLIKPEVQRVTERLLAEMAAPPGLEALAACEGLTPVQLVRAFTRAHGLPPFAWLNVERLKAARRALLRGERLSRLAADLGFADQAHLTRRFKAMYGVSPKLWALGGR